MAFDWTDAAVETMKRMWALGATVAEIADAIGAPTRNTVTGKVHRLGLSGRRPPARRKTPTRIEADRQEAEQRVRARGLITIMDLEAGMCRWPIGTPRTPDFGFCGCRVTDDAGIPIFGRSYCAAHAAVAVGRGTPSERAADKIHGSVE